MQTLDELLDSEEEYTTHQVRRPWHIACVELPAIIGRQYQ